MDNLYVLSVRIPGSGYLPVGVIYFSHFSCNFLVLAALERFELPPDPVQKKNRSHRLVEITV